MQIDFVHVAQTALTAIAGGLVAAVGHALAESKSRVAFEAAMAERVAAVDKRVEAIESNFREGKGEFRQDVRDMREDFSQNIAEMREEFRASSAELRTVAMAVVKTQEAQSVVNQQTTATLAGLVGKFEQQQNALTENTMTLSLMKQWCATRTKEGC